MQIKYKKIQKLVPHCGECGEELQGNGSYAMNYKCSCGEWVAECNDKFQVIGYKLKK